MTISNPHPNTKILSDLRDTKYTVHSKRAAAEYDVVVVRHSIGRCGKVGRRNSAFRTRPLVSREAERTSLHISASILPSPRGRRRRR